MPSASFTRTEASSPFYLLMDDARPRQLTEYGIGFAPSRQMTDNVLTLAQTWREGAGLYLFMPISLAKLLQPGFREVLRRLMSEPALKDLRFLWVENPTDPLASWRMNAIVARQAMSRAAFIDFRNYTLMLAGGSAVDLNAAQDGFVFTRAPDDPAGFALATAFGAHRLGGIGANVSLPMQGDSAGCVQFTLTLHRPPDGDNYAELSKLDISLRIFFRDGTFPGVDDDAFISSRRYPILAEDPAALGRYTDDVTLRATLDPVHMLLPGRTHFEFSNPPGKATMPSCYRTTLGSAIDLTPRPGSRLVFAPMPSTGKRDEEPPLYLVPAGDFDLHVAGNLTGDINLLCGLSGVEYIRLSRTDPNFIRFRPGNPAFAQRFATVEAMTEKLLSLLHDGIDRKRILDILIKDYFPTNTAFDSARAIDELQSLTAQEEVIEWFQKSLQVATPGVTERAMSAFTPRATTSWAYVGQEGEAAPVYFAQPDQAVMYRPIAAGNNVLQAVEIPAVGLPEADAVRAFPLFPYGGLDGDWLPDYRQLELQWIAPLRRRRIHEISAETGHSIPLVSGATGGAVVATTPQGLRATFSGNFETLETLSLAKGTDNKELIWSNLPRTSALRAALQSSQLFLVISNPDELKEFFTEHELTIQGWTFDLDPEKWRRQGTIMVLKFHEKSLLELVENPQAWSMPEQFVDDQQSVRRTVVQLLQDAIVKQQTGSPKERERYGPLARAAQFEEWSGIFALNVPVPRLPDEIEGLSAGIEQGKFYAQYIGIETTAVTLEGMTLNSSPSSLFGLIDYKDDTAPPPNSSGYDFEVTKLTALFVNSELKDFSSEIAVTLDRLFDEPARLANSITGRNILLLKGSSENHDGKVSYSFSFSGDNEFALPESKVIEKVEILKAQFATDPAVQTATASTSRFSFWGRLRFKHLEAFDILSFGQETPVAEGDDKYLSFSNLQVVMSVPNDKPQERTFDFNPRDMVFDLKRSNARLDSLYSKFPLKLTGLIYSEDEKTSNELGFLPVKSPLSGKLGATWYGLTFDLTLGSFGALAGKAGFVVSVLAAWSPSGAGGDGGVFVGLRLPGLADGKREFTIQGIIKIVFKHIEFLANKQGGTTSYVLKLKNIKLQFFVLSIPPSGQTEIIIFGNPAGDSTDKTLGWYAAYSKPPAVP